MKAAIPTFGHRVSPRFDCAATFLVVTFESDGVLNREQIDAAGWTRPQRVKRLIEQGVEVVVCGGIDRRSADSLMDMGVRVYGWLSGSIDENLAALQRGELQLEEGAYDRDDRCCHARRRHREGRRRTK